MTLQNIGGTFYLPFDPFNPSTTAVASFSTKDTASAASSGIAMIFRVPKNGTIDRVGFYLNVVTTGATLVVSIQNTSFPTVLPDGTNYGGSSPTSVVTTTGVPGYYEAVFSTPATAVAGDQIAVCFNQPATSFGSFASTVLAGVATIWPYNYPVYMFNTAGSAWALGSNTGPIVCGVGYSSTDYISIVEVGFPLSAAGSQNASTGGTAGLGNIFTPTFKTRVKGMWFKTTSTPRDAFLTLENNSGSALQTATFTAANWNAITATGALVELAFDSAATQVLTPGTQYRYVYNSNSATNVSISVLTCNSVGQLSAFPMKPQGQTVSGSTYTNITNAIVTGVGLVCDQFDDGAGGGGSAGILVNPRMTGGFR